MKPLLAAAAIALVLPVTSISALAADTTVWKAANAKAIPTAPLKGAAVTATGYAESNVTVASMGDTLNVTLVDSRLLGQTQKERDARDAEAARVVAAIASVIAGRPEYAAVTTIHVGYAKREGTDLRIVDAVDFARDSQGRFSLDVS